MDPRIESILYRGVYGHNSCLSPLGYGRIQKIVYSGRGVHSATTQHAIHSFALQYESNVLYIPKVYSCSANYYVMEHLVLTHRVAQHDYFADPVLARELCQFFVFMFNGGYYPFGFSIALNDMGKYVLIDFSQFGHVQGAQIKFKHLRAPISVESAEHMYGIAYFRDLHEASFLSSIIYDPMVISKKIEEPDSESSSSGASTTTTTTTQTT
jgi:hypothetical protein